MAELNQSVAGVMADVVKESPAARAGWTTDTATLRDAQFGPTWPTLMLLGAAILALALIACANLTNLTVAEVANRRGEFVLRTALGARRRDLIRAQAVESLLLSVVGLVAGLVVAAWTLPAVLSLDPATAKLLGPVTIDWRVQAASCTLALAVSLTAGVLPALWATRGDMARGLAAGTLRLTGGRRQRRVRFVLVAAETLLSVVLLTSGALLVSAFSQSARANPGFDPHHVLGAQLRLPAASYKTLESRAAFVHTMLERVRSAPGVVEASTTANLFVPGFAFITLVKIEGRPSPDGQAYTVQFRRISPGYFRTMRIPELAGRTFDDRDVSPGLLAAVVSRSFADRFWPGEDPIGRRVQRASAVLTVIGVVGDVSDVGFSQPPAPTIYGAYAQNNIAAAPVSLVVRTSGDPDGAVKTVARAIHEVDPAQPLSGVTTLDRFLSDSLGPERFRSVLLTVFASLGLALAAVGIYGVTSRGVAERSREMGVRLALGCEPGRIWRLVLRQSLAAVVTGFAAGVPIAAATAAFLRHSLPGVSAGSAVAAVPALAALASAAFVAAALPARRATRVDPLSALRQS
jgi:putative ABC transport system permease protein